MNKVPNGYTEVLRTDDIKKAITYVEDNYSNYVIVSPYGYELYPEKESSINVALFFQEGDWVVGKKNKYQFAHKLTLVKAINAYYLLNAEFHQNVGIGYGNCNAFTSVENIDKNITDGIYSNMEIRSNNWSVRWE